MNCGVRMGHCGGIGRQIQKIRSSSKNFTERAEAKIPLNSETVSRKKMALGNFKTVTSFYCIVSKAVFNISLGYIKGLGSRDVCKAGCALAGRMKSLNFIFKLYKC